MTSDQPLSTRKEDDMTPRLEAQRLEAAQKLRENAQRNSGTVIPDAQWATFMADYEDLDYSGLEDERDELEHVLLNRQSGRPSVVDDNTSEYELCQRLGALTALLDDRYDPTPAHTKYPGPNGRPGSW